jgi:HK97 gp10 family phage protein
MNGIDLREFDKLIQNVDKLERDIDSVAVKVLKVVGPPAKDEYIKKMPPKSDRNKPHARDHVTIKDKKGEYGRYIIIGPTGGYTTMKRKNKKGKSYLAKSQDYFSYLYVLEYGRHDMPARPWIRKANNAAIRAAKTKATVLLSREVQNGLEV